MRAPAAENREYRGRFAPTPSGPLHLGSLLTALAGFLAARSCGGRWLLRIDDLDRERCRDDAEDAILRQLEAHGLYWDESRRRQSEHVEAYEAAFAQLTARDRVYACACTRAQLARDSVPGIDGPVYAGTCRRRPVAGERRAWRLRVGEGTRTLDDACQRRLQRELQQDVGDFIVRRVDGQIAYQLACVVDEREQRISEVVRGADLIGSSIRQVLLQEVLSWPTPAYVHVPLLLDSAGQKLSKQNHAAPLAPKTAARNLWRCLQLLGQNPPPELRHAGVQALLQWGLENWNLGRIPCVATMPVSDVPS